MTAPRTFPVPLPERMARLPVSPAGFPVPWFVGWLDAAGTATPRGTGTPDFRAIHPGAIETAVHSRICWLCGESLGSRAAFVIGPMCSVNRVSSEPGSHLECATFAARACPFLANPKRERRTDNMPAGRVPPAGIMIPRNPGVALVWTTKRWKPFRAGAGVLFELGDPERVEWWAEGRVATRAEVLASIDGGLPSLEAAARLDGPSGLAALADAVKVAQRWLPAEVTP